MAEQTLGDLIGRQLPTPQPKALERSDTKHKTDASEKNDDRRVLKRTRSQCE